MTEVVNLGSGRDEADRQIDSCLSMERPTSFFLFAGAGSGKTRALVGALRELIIRHGQALQLRGQQIAVITYTNAATDEIKRRLDFDPLLSVSTIHSFVWELIKGFNSDIREWLKQDLAREIADLEAAQAKGRATSQAFTDRARKIVSNRERLSSLGSIRTFIYSPTGDNRTRDSLNHAEVIKLGATFLTQKPLMQELLVRKYPFLLIDESQDTNKDLIDAFFAVQATHSAIFCLGLFGDTMQRIYADGKIGLGVGLPAEWQRPAKKINYRCPKRVIELINRIRSEVDDQMQTSKEDAPRGMVRFFIARSEGTDRELCERQIRRRMAEFTGDENWSRPDQVKTLTLEHRLAFERMGCLNLFDSLDSISEFGTGLRDGTLPMLAFFANIVRPLVRSAEKKDNFKVAAIVRKYSPLLDAKVLEAAGMEQDQKLVAARQAVELLMALFKDQAAPTFLQVLQCIASTGLFAIPESLKPFVNEKQAVIDTADESEPPDETEASKRLVAIRQFLSSQFWQIEPYTAYVSGMSPLATHQGVKGLEFPRVLVVMDDSKARGFLFNYDKLFGAKEQSAADTKNAQSGSETGIDRTRRLFYVTCSRARESLALMAYSENPAVVQQTLVVRGWFKAEEIEILG